MSDEIKRRLMMILRWNQADMAQEAVDSVGWASGARKDPLKIEKTTRAVVLRMWRTV